MKRVFYSDYGADPFRIEQIETFLRHLKDRGVAVCRTCRNPLDSAALTVPLPGIIQPDMSSLGLTLAPKVLNSNPLLRVCGQIFNSDYPRRKAADCYGAAVIYRTYIEQELEQFSPDLVILWHQFNAYHYIIADWCQRRGIPIMYGENGVLPGSWCFELAGQMAESWVARDPARFATLPLDTADIAHAETYLDHILINRVSRKAGMTQLSETELPAILANDRRPKVLYAGINDFKTGLQPYWSERTPLHAGDFTNTEQGLLEVLRAARRNNWHVLYKAHPSIKENLSDLEQYHENLTVIHKKVDLLELLPVADVLATIVSQSAYMAILHGRPAVIMGRMQLSGTGLVGEALYAGQLEGALRQAITEPREQKAALLEHIARLLRYYVISPLYGERGYFRFDLSDFAQSIVDMKRVPVQA